MFEYQNLDYLNDALTINVWYTPLATTRNVKAYYLIVAQTNNGAADEDIEVELTIDGTVYTVIKSMISGQVYYYRMTPIGTIDPGSTNPYQMLSLDLDQSAPLETRSLGIRVRQTSAVDATGAVIEVNMVYATKELTRN